MAGPSQSDKLKYVAKDSSFKTQEGFSRLFINIFIVLILGAVTWFVCTTLKLGVMHTTEYLFSPFEAESETIGNYKLITNEELSDRSLEHHNSIVEKNNNEGIMILIAVMFFGALVRGILIRNKSWHSSEGDGATQTISYFLESYSLGDAPGVVAKHRYSKSTLRHALKRYIMTFLTLGCGGSGGLEGPVIPIGECLGAFLAKTFRIYNTDDLRAFQMAGIAAAVCTLLNAPFASAIFAAEVVYSERIVYRTLLYSIFSVIIAFSLNTLFLGQGKLFVVAQHNASYGFFEYMNVVLVAIVCSGPIGVGLNYTFKFFKTKFNYIPVLLRSPIGAMCAAGIALGLWFWLGIEPTHVLGMGEETIEDLLYGVGNEKLHIWWVLSIVIVAKVLATGLTLMTGGSAGLLIPAMVLGGCMGGVLHGVLLQYFHGFHTGIELFIISGIGSALVSIIEVPISAVLLIISIFGESYAPPAMLSVAVCHLLVKNLKLYLHK
ncbi:MAG: chloride channel protein [Legionellales bacterium]|mgnify:CR=1 FL=1|jgi:chloride channel protein, CIC family|nr:chloride channel protein [Legionellales bacterium]